MFYRPSTERRYAWRWGNNLPRAQTLDVDGRLTQLNSLGAHNVSLGWNNTIHVASVHEYVAAEKTFKTVAGSGGVSAAPTELEGNYAWNWARTIWADALA